MALSREQRPFALQLPGNRLDTDSGDAHREACLRAFESEHLKESDVVVHRHPPLLVVIHDVHVCFGPAASVRHFLISIYW